MQEYGMRLEDYGSQTMDNLPRLSIESIKKGFYQYLLKLNNVKYFIIISNKVGYYNVFKVESEDIYKKIDNIISFLENSRYYNIQGEVNPYVEMIDVRHYELNEEHGHFELWIGKEYFQFFPFDWGVEIV
jgi:hypothetical protein